MGTGFDMTALPEELGVIPQAVQEIFVEIQERKSSATERNEPIPQFEVKAQFLEVCNYVTNLGVVLYSNNSAF